MESEEEHGENNASGCKTNAAAGHIFSSPRLPFLGGIGVRESSSSAAACSSVGAALWAAPSRAQHVAFRIVVCSSFLAAAVVVVCKSQQALPFGRAAVQSGASSKFELRLGPQPLPVILDTDIGDDFDDSWALALAVSSPEVWDVRLVLTAQHDVRARGQIVAKYLTLWNRSDIPIGLGVPTPGNAGGLYGWAANFDLGNYKGTIFPDGVQAAAQIIAATPGITIIALAPMTNLQKLLSAYPLAVTQVSAMYSMFGSIARCYGGAPVACPEFNVAQNVAAAQSTAGASWPIVVTPLDTCEIVMTGEPWYRLQSFDDDAHVMVQVLLDSLRAWGGSKYTKGCSESDVIFDAVAMYMSSIRAPLNMERVRIAITDDGRTMRDDVGGVEMLVALTWQPGGMEAFFNDLSTRLIQFRPKLG